VYGGIPFRRAFNAGENVGEMFVAMTGGFAPQRFLT
jgi:hypothetical protein